MAHAVVLKTPGGPEQLEWKDAPALKPGKGEVLVRQTAVGVNFIDIYHRTGLYPLPSYPAVLGVEGAGIVESVGEGVKDFAAGDRVAYSRSDTGAYAEQRLIPEAKLVKLPQGISESAAAAMMIKGLTAEYLLRRTFPVKKGDTILIHAAAGGVGLLVCQWAKHLGATVIGTVGSEEKAELARENGCDHPILYNTEKVSQRVKEITGGKMADVVYDSVGRTTFMDSLDCLRPLGMMVSFGQSSGKVDPFDTSILAQKGSLFLTRPTLFHYIADTAVYRAAAAELFDLVGKGVLKVRVDRELPLRDAADAHRLLEARATTGAVVLKP